jgi:hypothetical protein
VFSAAFSIFVDDWVGKTNIVPAPSKTRMKVKRLILAARLMLRGMIASFQFI